MKKESIERLFIFVDLVNGFIKKGNMADSYIEHIIPDNVNLIESIKNDNDASIAFMMESHDKECQEFKKFPEHCVTENYESELVGELKPYESDALVYKKNSTCGIFAPNFINDINKMKALREVIVSGCCTDICVMNLAIPLVNYFDQENKDVSVIIPTDCCETYDSEFHNRDKYNEMAYLMCKQNGIQLVKKYRGVKDGK